MDGRELQTTPATNVVDPHYLSRVDPLQGEDIGRQEEVVGSFMEVGTLMDDIETMAG